MRAQMALEGRDDYVSAENLIEENRTSWQNIILRKKTLNEEINPFDSDQNAYFTRKRID